MAKDSFIDLGREYEPCSTPAGSDSKKGEKRVSYPTLYISGVEGLDLSTGEITFTAKGKVVSVSRRETEDDGEHCACEIEVHSISAPGAKAEEDSEDSEDGLDKALDTISKKKASSDDEEDNDEE